MSALDQTRLPPHLIRESLVAMADEVAVLDHRGTIVFVNPAWRRAATETSTGAEVGVNFLRLQGFDEGMRAGLEGVLSQQLSSFEYEYREPGSPRWCLVRASALEFGGAIILNVDITARKQSELKAEAASCRDPLTGTLNRRGLEERLRAMLRGSMQRGESCSALFVDCEDFKAINDAFGQSVGDEVLHQLGERLCQSVRPNDVVARVGGDEFIVLLDNTNEAGAQLAAERVAEAVRVRPLTVVPQPVFMRLNSTVVSLEGVTTLDDILRRSVQGLKHAKAKSTTRSGVRDQPRTPAEFQTALASLEVAMHEVTELASGKRSAVAISVRSPGSMYPTADALFGAAQQFACLLEAEILALQKCFKVLPKVSDIAHISIFPSTVLALGAAQVASWLPAGVSPSRVCLALREQHILGDPSSLMSSVTALRELGFWVAVDGIGFGRNGLESLIVLAPEIVTIDHRIVSQVAATPSKARTLDRLIRVCRALKADVVVKGLETPADAEMVLRMGATYAQSAVEAALRS